jgi:nucleoside-diphosphate-sugar epimerase
MEKEDWLYRALHGRTIVFSRDIAQKVTTLSYGPDVARGMYGIICNEKAYGKTYHITTQENHTWDSVLEMYLNAIENFTGRKPRVYYTDKWEPWQGGFKYQVKYDRLFDRRFDNTAIMNDVQNLAFNDLEDSIYKALSEMVKHPSYRFIDFAKEAMKDRLAGDWTKLGEIPRIKGKIKYLLIRLGLIKYTFA